MLRNREVTRTLIVSLALVAVCALAAATCCGPEALPWVLLAGAAATVPWLALTRQRYRALAPEPEYRRCTAWGSRA